jgi:hypothetical protein
VLVDREHVERRHVGINRDVVLGKFAFKSGPERRSITACSCSANETPQIMPPNNWLRTMRD